MSINTNHTYIQEQLSTLPSEQALSELQQRVKGLTDPNDIAYQKATQMATNYLQGRPELQEFNNQLTAFQQWLAENPQIQEEILKNPQRQQRINFALWGTAKPHESLWMEFIQLSSIPELEHDLQEAYDPTKDLQYAKTVIPDILTEEVRKRPVAFLSRLYLARLYRTLQKWKEARSSFPEKLLPRSTSIVNELLNMQWFYMHPEIAELLRNQAKAKDI